jgi:hypothetical protein
MFNEYITMHDEIMSQKWVIGGPLLELSVLSLVPELKKDKINNSTCKIPGNRLVFIKYIYKKIKELKPVIEIIEKDERIYYEIELLNSNKLENNNKTKIIDFKIYINIGIKRKGRILLELKSENIIGITIMYEDHDYNFKNKKNLNKLLIKIIKYTNGICGAIGHENTISSIIKVDQLLVDNNIKSFYDIKWNHKVKYFTL